MTTDKITIKVKIDIILRMHCNSWQTHSSCIVRLYVGLHFSYNLIFTFQLLCFLETI